MKRIAALSFMTMLVTAPYAAAPTPSTYAGQETREIKALSADEVNSMLAGKGMGLAKTAELNGYPGPAHVLELAPALRLSEQQRKQTEALFASMESKAIELGKSLVAEERRLDQAFADRTVTRESLAPALARIGELQAKLRVAHLEAHLEQSRILTPEQIAQYAQLRGYGAARDKPSVQGGHRH